MDHLWGLFKFKSIIIINYKIKIWTEKKNRELKHLREYRLLLNFRSQCN